MLFPPALAVKTKALPGVGGGECTPMVRLPDEQPVFRKTPKKKTRNTKQEKIAARNKPSGKTLIAHSFRPPEKGRRDPQRHMAGLESCGEAGCSYDSAAQVAITRVS